GRRRRRGGDASGAPDGLQDLEGGADEALTADASQPEFDFDDIAPARPAAPVQVQTPAPVHAEAPVQAEAKAPTATAIAEEAPQGSPPANAVAPAAQAEASPARVAIDTLAASEAIAEPEADTPPADDAETVEVASGADLRAEQLRSLFDSARHADAGPTEAPQPVQAADQADADQADATASAGAAGEVESAPAAEPVPGTPPSQPALAIEPVASQAAPGVEPMAGNGDAATAADPARQADEAARPGA
ncbi:MAG TPA: hypothetical protein VL251_07830, partial [Thermomonas sp.]|nr:hypothetical protein [Thermomonas sp.]